MSSASPTRSSSPHARRFARRLTGRAASAGLLFAFIAPLFLAGLTACGKDDDKNPAQPTGVANGADVPDASVRDLPGDGLEPTPDFDIDGRQRNPIGVEQRNESIDRIQNGNSGGYGARDAGTSGGNPGDAGAANGTN